MAILLLSGCDFWDTGTHQSYRSHQSTSDQAQKAVLEDDSDSLLKLLQSGLYPSSDLLDLAIKHKAQKCGIVLIEHGTYFSDLQFKEAYAQGLDNLVMSMIEKSSYLPNGFDEKIIKDKKTNLLKKFTEHRNFSHYNYKCMKYVETALQNKHGESLKILFQKNICLAKIQTGDYSGRTPLHLAVEDRKTNSVQLLLNNGAASIINHQDNYQNTALDLRIKALDSMRPESDEILTLLCAHGALAQNESSKYSCGRGWKQTNHSAGEAPPPTESGPSLEECISFYKQEDSNFNINWDLQHSSEERDTLSKKTFRVLTRKFHKDLGSSETNRAEKMQKTTECNNVFFERL
ncbi:MAG: ankyrin repeat domain-containing protein [Myxococcaceae bacterium]